MRYCTTHSTSAAFRSPVTIDLSSGALCARLVVICVARSSEAELKFQLPARWQDSDFIDAEGEFEMQTRLDRFQKLSETQNDGFGFRLHCIIRCPGQDNEEDDRGDGHDRPHRNARHMRHLRSMNGGRLIGHRGVIRGVAMEA